MPDTVWVVVLGDFGRSPRMQYHAWSLAAAGYDVRVLASPGSPPIAPLLAAPNVAIHYLPPPPSWVERLPAVLALAAKAAAQALLMLWAVLAALPRPAAILMQNPPAIPVMAVLWLAALRHRAALVIDWHNLAYSILALKHARRRWLVGLARAYEKAFGARAAAAFCVTRALRSFLQREFGVDAAILYDRPPASFRPLGPAERRQVLARLLPQLRAAAIGADVLKGVAGAAEEEGVGGGGKVAAAAKQVAAGKQEGGGQDRQQQQQQQQQQRQRQQPNPDGAAPRWPAVVVSSTSWTPDEDFGILLEAALQYDAVASAARADGGNGGGGGVDGSGRGSGGSGVDGVSSSNGGGGNEGGEFPDVLFVITGRGPQRAKYLEKISRLRLKRCAFASVWLEPEDYPLLLGAADLGVCLHTSSSGLDLPMKVVDMFGAGLPVCAVDYQCIGELVRDSETGLLFSTPQQLSDQLARLLRGFGGGGGGGGGGVGGELARMRAEVARAHDGWRWHANWDAVAGPVIAAACRGGPRAAAEAAAAVSAAEQRRSGAGRAPGPS